MFKFIKEYYILGLYNDEDLNIFINAKWMSKTEKEELINNKKNVI